MRISFSEVHCSCSVQFLGKSGSPKFWNISLYSLLSTIWFQRNGNVLFKGTLNTFFFSSYVALGSDSLLE